MVERRVVEFVDDLDNKSEAIGTISFAFQGFEYEVDLSQEHYNELQEALSPFVAVARVVRRPRRPNSAIQPSTTDIAGAPASVVRQWAMENGYEIAPMGRIPEEIAVAYASR